MTEIPMPEALEPTFARSELARASESGDTDNAIAALSQAMEQLSSYARQLWEELDATRGYLMHHVARGAPDTPVVGAQPLLSTEEQWATWADRYAKVMSVLCGPRGDEGLGATEARHEANTHGHLLPEQPPTMSPRGT